MLLIPDAAPLTVTLRRAIEALREAGAPVSVARNFLEGVTAVGAVGGDDSLDSARDPAVDEGALRSALLEARVPEAAVSPLVDAILDRESVLDLSVTHAIDSRFRPPTLFELASLFDVIGAELGSWLSIEKTWIARAAVARGLNHCEMGGDGVARIRLVATNGVTLAGRTHAVVHELGHALIGHARAQARSYRAPYGGSDYGRFFAPETFDEACDEEALVRAISDAWLLRRRAVGWARTWPGAVDEPGRAVDADDLAAFCRFRLAQGLGFPAEPVVVRRMAV